MPLARPLAALAALGPSLPFAAALSGALALTGCLAGAPDGPHRAAPWPGAAPQAPEGDGGSASPGAAPEGPRLLVPVAGVAPQAVPDTFSAPLSGGRVHEAADILAPRGTPVVSADDGLLLKVGQNRYGGNVLYAMDPSGRLIYYYAHLDRFAPGLGAGQPLRRGDLLGFVGTTGNAPPNTPHLHFQVMLRPGDGSIHGGRPIDPRPLFAFAGPPPSEAPAAAPGPVLVARAPAPRRPERPAAPRSAAERPSSLPPRAAERPAAPPSTARDEAPRPAPAAGGGWGGERPAARGDGWNEGWVPVGALPPPPASPSSAPEPAPAPASPPPAPELAPAAPPAPAPEPPLPTEALPRP